MNEFKELGLDKRLIDILEEMRFKTPSEIQKETIPLILEGKDIIGNAATGSGKTLAFASGILEKAKKREGIQALVLTPTRELAEQISKVIRKFSRNYDLKVQEIYGGVGFERQTTGSKKAEIIIGTPGRILDHLQKRTFNFSKIKILVLDEADRMVDMGFLPDVDKIINQCNKDRQTLLFSATTSSTVKHISKKYMKNSQEITVKKYVDSSKLKQYYYDVPSRLKFSLLAHFLKKEKSGISMVFCNTRRNVDLVEVNLGKYGIHAHAIHGGLDQKKRMRIMELFHNNKADILVCTDVAARGLDINDVTHVYNYDSPKTSDDYIHRVGRTARAGKEGKAITVLSNRDYENFRNVLKDDSIKIEKKEMPEIEKLNPNFKDEKPKFRSRERFGQRHNSSRDRDSGRKSSYENRKQQYGNKTRNSKPNYGNRNKENSYGNKRRDKSSHNKRKDYKKNDNKPFYKNRTDNRSRNSENPRRPERKSDSRKPERRNRSR